METLADNIREIALKDYKAGKEAFVINNTTPSVFECVSVIYMCLPYYVLYQYVFNLCIQKNWKIFEKTTFARTMLFLIDCVFFIMTSILSQVLPQWHIILASIAVILSFIISEYLRRNPVNPDARLYVNQNKDFPDCSPNDKVKTYFTMFRGNVMVLTVIAIMAVDFPIFPRRFAKTLEFGNSLMDMGVGIFVINSGMVARQIRSNKHGLKTILNALSSVSPLIILGVARFIMVLLTGYQHIVTEYGVHWNFFFTLAAVAIFSAIFAGVMTTNVRIVAFMIISMGIYQFWLLNGGTEYLLSDVRTSYFDMNKEGIMSCIGYFAIYSGGILIGKAFLKERTTSQWNSFIKKYMLVMVFLWVLSSLVSTYVQLPSRRIANTAYVLLCMACGGTCVGIGLYIHLKLIYIYVPVIYQSINYNQLLIFLVANIMTGLINFTFKTLFLSSTESFIVLTLYTLSIVLLGYVLYYKNIKVKFW
ncbi:hypothetical protein WA158_002487 [Blastocystis sp. Blastoise]